jgi:hypothetical protein
MEANLRSPYFCTCGQGQSTGNGMSANDRPRDTELKTLVGDRYEMDHTRGLEANHTQRLAHKKVALCLAALWRASSTLPSRAQLLTISAYIKKSPRVPRAEYVNL